MGLPVVGAAANRSCNTRGFDGIEKVRIERCVKTIGTFGRDRERFIKNCADSSTIDFLHREDAHAGLLDHLALLGVDVADPYHYGVLGLNFRRKLKYVG